MRRLRDDRGQALVLATLLMTSFLGLAAIVVDAGSWFRAHRQLQAMTDAAALAGAQRLPHDTSGANSLALDFAGKNDGAGASTAVSFTSTVDSNDTIVVISQRDAPGFFAHVFGIRTVTVHARARARAASPGQAKYVAPIVVHDTHPQIRNFGTQTTLTLVDLHKPGSGDAAGSFGLINLNQGDSNGNVGSKTLADWMTRGYQDNMDLGNYHAVPSSRFNDSQFDSALSGQIGKEVLFPVYDRLTEPGDNAIYHIIGWVGFHVTGFDPRGSNGTVSGWFTRYIAEGIPATGGGSNDFGVRIVTLEE